MADEELAARFGVEVVHAGGAEVAALRAAVSEEDIAAEMAADLEGAEKLNDFSEECHRGTVRDCLAVRRWLELHRADAFTVNFLDISPAMGLDSMPFMEACKAMARGIGYAGEGDTLTAALVGALLHGFESATFVEIFCPDWENNTLFLSHMGEVNYALIDGRPALKEMPFIYGEAKNPVIGYARYRKGKAVFVNLFRDAEGYKLLVAPVTMEEPVGEDRFASSMRGWMRPAMPVGEFLEALSRAGATHHSALVYALRRSSLPSSDAFWVLRFSAYKRKDGLVLFPPPRLCRGGGKDGPLKQKFFHGIPQDNLGADIYRFGILVWIFRAGQEKLHGLLPHGFFGNIDCGQGRRQVPADFDVVKPGDRNIVRMEHRTQQRM